MATFKHISSKNADYGAAEAYLTFEHDEFTMKATLDENGRLIPREDYRISSLNCGGEDFAVACMRANLRYEKNQKREDVKSHHYIISFDPRDGTDNGLTVDRAQELGEQFCKEHFPGHQALVCTHPDGHNHSGNMLSEAEKYLGYPYVWGGSSPATSFDCSGFVSWVINHSGWNVGRLGAQGLYNICTRTSSPRPGDLVFFKGTYDTPGVSHVGIYVGDGMMIHCGDPISYANLNTSYWQSHFYAYGRLP